MESPLLNKFFMKLTEGNEARRCLHYLFRVKCERIDTSFFTVKNLQKTYLRYRDHYKASKGETGEESKDVFDRSRSSVNNFRSQESINTSKTEREQAFYKEMFI